MPENVIAYFDYLCPFAWRGAEVAHQVAKPLGLHFQWQHFSLYQSNAKTEGWQLWHDRLDTEDVDGSKGLVPFLASIVAREQGEKLYDTFRLELLRARHRHDQALNLKTIYKVAQQIGLDTERFTQRLNTPEIRTILAHEHHQAVTLGVFGTPTFHFQEHHLAYFRISELPKSLEESVKLFSDYRNLLEKYPYLETIKRPKPV